MANVNRNANAVGQSKENAIKESVDSVDLGKLVGEKSDSPTAQPAEADVVNSFVETKPVETPGYQSVSQTTSPSATVVANQASTIDAQKDQQQGVERKKILSAGVKTSGDPKVDSGSVLQEQKTAESADGYVNSIHDDAYMKPVKKVPTDTNISTGTAVNIDTMSSSQKNEIAKQSSESGYSQKIEARIESADSVVSERYANAPMFAGISKKPTPPQVDHMLSNATFLEAREFKQDQAANNLGKKNYSGNSVYETIVNEPDTEPCGASLGHENLIDMMSQPGNILMKLIEEYVGVSLLLKDCEENPKLLIDTINRCNIPCLLDKGPTNWKWSVQKRYLRAHYGRGIGLHPTQLASYNADVDGDNGTLMLDQNNVKMFTGSMDLLLDMDGNPTIDPKYFPLDDVEFDELELSLAENNLKWDPAAAKALAVPYYELCKNKTSEYWTKFIRAIDSYAKSSKYDSMLMSSKLLESFYDFSVMKRGNALKTEWEGSLSQRDSYKRPPSPEQEYIEDIVGEMAAGRPGPSFHAFEDAFSRFYGDTAEKDTNPEFRERTNRAKGIKRTERISFGKEDIFEKWQATCEAGVSKEISGRLHMGSTVLKMNEEVIKKTMSEVGFPTSRDANGNLIYSSFVDFIDTFAESYNKHARLMRISSTVWRHSILPYRENVDIYDGIPSRAESVKAFCDAYGSYTVSTMFPSIEYSESLEGTENTTTRTLSRFADESINRFIKDNRFKVDASREKKKVNSGKGNIEMSYLSLIADRKNTQLAAYEKTFVDMTTKHVYLFRNIEKELNNNDYQMYAEDMTRALYLASPRMFDFYGMDNPRNFIKSPEGSRLYSANNQEEYASQWVRMLTYYRLKDYRRYKDKVKDVSENSAISEQDRKDRIEALESRSLEELRHLGSSSMAWEAVTSEIADVESSTFRYLVDVKGKHNSKMFMYASKFWQSETAEKTNITTLEQALMSKQLSYSMKMFILADVVRVRNSYPQIKSMEMIGQLAMAPSSSGSGIRFMNDFGLKKDIDDARDSIDQYARFKNKNYERAMKHASRLCNTINSPEKFAKMYGEGHDPAILVEEHIKMLDSVPGYAVYVNPSLVGDFISSSMNADYPDSEKGQHQTATDALYSGLAYDKNGGMLSDLYRCDDRVIGQVGKDNLTYRDIVHILANPDEHLDSYDEYGRPFIVTRESLCGGLSTQNLLSFLESNPKLSYSLRRTKATVVPDVDATTYVSEAEGILDSMAKIDINESLITSQAVASLVMHKYKFLAITAMLTPMGSSVARSMKKRYERTFGKLCSLAEHHARKKNKNESFDPGNEFVEIVKLTPQDAVDAGVEEQIALGLVDEVYDAWNDVVDEILSNEGIDNSRLSKQSHAKQMEFSFDKRSILSYYSVRQEASSAKTSSGTGIEGRETKRNQMLEIFLLSRKDKYIEVYEGMPDVESLNAVLAEENRPTVDELLANPESDGTEIIEAPEGYVVMDKTLERNRHKQISGAAKFVSTKREKGAEENNLKVAKYGDDGTNVIVKFGKYRDQNEVVDWKTRMFDAYAKSGNKRDAVEILAGEILAADVEAGYTDINKTFFFDDYMNLADVLVLEDDRVPGGLVVRSIEQLSTACRNLMPREIVDTNDLPTMIAKLEEIVSNVGVEQCPDPIGVLNRIKQAPGGRGFDGGSAISPRSSSQERAYETISRIVEDNPGLVLRSRKEIRKTIKNAGLYINKNFDGLLDNLKGIAFPMDKYNPNTKAFETNWDGSVENVYDLIGASSWDGLKINPGPQSLVVIDGNDEKRDAKVLSWCARFGMTALFANRKSVPKDMLEDTIQLTSANGSTFLAINYFDIMMNGGDFQNVQPEPGTFPFSVDQVMVTVEDTSYEIKPGDASFHGTQEMFDNINVNVPGEIRMTKYDLFPNIFDNPANKALREMDTKLEVCTREEVQRDIIERFDEVAIDVGAVQGTDLFYTLSAQLDLQIDRYVDQFFRSDAEKSFLTGELRPNRIVAWAKLVLDGSMVVYAPIIPFPFDASGMAPRRFEITSANIDVNEFEQSIEFGWRFAGGLEGQYIKTHEGAGNANKMIVRVKPIKSRTLDNGTPIHGMYSKQTTGNRRLGWNERLDTMVSLMMVPRIDENYAYNFAELPDAFPENPDLKTILQTRPLRRDEWVNGSVVVDPSDPKSAIRFNPKKTRYHSDKNKSDFIRSVIKKCLQSNTINPSDFLMTKAGSSIWHQYFEFGYIFEANYMWQENLMSFLNEMHPTLVPALINGDDSSCLFKPVKGRLDDVLSDVGVLKMNVPHFDKKGNEYKVPETVIISFGFFSDEFSGFKRVNVNGASIYMDDLNSMIWSGAAPSSFNLREYMRSASAWSGEMLDDSNLIAIDDSGFMEKVSEDDATDKPFTIAFTGRRPKDLWGYKERDNYSRLKNTLVTVINDTTMRYGSGRSRIVTGGAQGVDQIAFWAAEQLKREGANIENVVHVPFVGQENKWPDENGMFGKKEYGKMLELSDSWIDVSNGGSPSDQNEASEMMKIRNKSMIDSSNMVIAVHQLPFDINEKGGTADATRHAVRTGKPVMCIDPETGELGLLNGEVFESTGPVADSNTMPIDKFRGEYGFLSNMYDVPVKFRGMTFKNAEAAFQSQKDPSRAGEFVNLSGKEAKKLGGNVSLRNDWDEVKTDIMCEVLFNKFSDNPNMMRKLKKTAPRKLEEGNNWGDTYWGTVNGQGDNVLGRILMDIRDDYDRFAEIEKQRKTSMDSNDDGSDAVADNASSANDSEKIDVFKLTADDNLQRINVSKLTREEQNHLWRLMREQSRKNREKYGIRSVRDDIEVLKQLINDPNF